MLVYISRVNKRGKIAQAVSSGNVPTNPFLINIAFHSRVKCGLVFIFAYTRGNYDINGYYSGMKLHRNEG